MSADAQIVEVPAVMPTATALSLVRPVATPAALLTLHDDVTEIIQKALKLGLDYDTIPGTGDKPSLLKPGAEKLNLAFGAAPEYDILEQEVDHDREVRWTKKKKKWNNKFKGDRTFTFEMEDGTSLALYRYVVRCRIVREGRVLATCIGVCSTLESKYIDRPRDCENTALKMAQKRAYVGATLHAYALSNRFTQDVEDNRDLYAKEPPAAQMTEEEIPFGSPKPVQAPPAAKPGYDGGPAHQKFLKDALKAKGVPEEFWEDIHNRMMGRTFNDLPAVLEEARKA